MPVHRELKDEVPQDEGLATASLRVVSSSSQSIPPLSGHPGGWRISRSSVRLFNQDVDFRMLLLGAVEFLLLMAALQLGTIAWFGGDLVALRGDLGSIWAESGVFATVMLVSLLAMGLYNRRLDQRTVGILARQLVGLAIGAAAMAILMYLTDSMRLGRGALLLGVVIALPLLAISRVLFVMALGRDRFARRVLVIGAGEKASDLRNIRVRQDLRGFEVVGFMPTDEDTRQVPSEWQLDIRHEMLRAFVTGSDVDEVVVAVDDRRRGLPVAALLDCRLAGVPVTDALTFIERESGKVELKMLYPSWLIFSEGINPRGISRLITRLFDLVVGALLLAITLPLIVLATLAIWIESGLKGPILYRQKRVGAEGSTFILYQFRSMEPDAEANGAQWATENDPRVTAVGRLIRRTRIDELPQLLNVLKGDMSFVGPRPERPEFVEQLSADIPYYRERHCVKPGITGWAQLCYPYGASTRDALEKLQYDLYYVKNKSFMFDLMILLQTVEVVLWRKGAR